jgi:hypothetical protein
MPVRTLWHSAFAVPVDTVAHVPLRQLARLVKVSAITRIFGDKLSAANIKGTADKQRKAEYMQTTIRHAQA